MKNLILIILYSTIIIMIGACGSDESPNEIPIEFEFRLLDENGNPSTTFKEGENFVFSFLITNKTSQTWYLEAFDNNDFFRVIEIDNAETGKDIDMGQPFNGMFCNKIGGISLSVDGVIEFKTPWTVNEFYYDNKTLFCTGNNANPLMKGNYKISFTNRFQFFVGDEVYMSDSLNFSIDFKVN